MRFSRSELECIICGFAMMSLIVTPTFSLAGLFVDPITAELGIPKGDFSFHISICMLMNMLGCLVIGQMLERFSIRSMAVTAALLIGICDVMYTFSTSAVHFWIISVVLGGASVAAGVAPISVLISRNIPKEKSGLALGITMSGTGVGGMVLSPVISAINNGPGWRWTYCLLAALSIGVVLPVLIFLLPRDGNNEAIEKESSETRSKEQLRKTVHSGVFRVYMIAAVMIGFSCSMFSVTGYSFFRSINIDPAGAALLISLQGASLSVFKLVVGAATDKLGTKTTGYITSLSLGLCYVLFVLCAFAGWLCVPAVLLYALGNTVITVCMPVLTRDLLGFSNYARMIGFVNVASWAGQSIAATSGQRMFDITGSYVPSMTIGIFTGLAAFTMIILSYALKRRAC